MSKNCHLPPKDKKDHIAEVGKILVNEYGKKKYYEPEEVKKASKKSSRNSTSNFYCWDMSVFCSHEAFDAYHKMIDESCDYIEMKKEMLTGITNNSSLEWASIPDMNLDASWLDLGELFEGVADGIGEFFSAIFDAV